MLYLLSPAKSLDYQTRVPATLAKKASEPLYLAQATELITVLKRKTAAQVAALFAFRRELALDHHLSGDPGMVGAGKPQRQEAAHAMPAHDDVHLRLVEHVAHVQASGDVGRR